MSETVDSGQGAGGALEPLADIFSRGSSSAATEDVGQTFDGADDAAATETGDTGRADGPARDASGRFAGRAEASTDAAPPAVESEPATVPVAALKDERVKRQQAEARLAELLAKQADPAKAAAPPSPPSPTQDPDGYASYVTEAAFNERLNISEMLIREKLGDETVDAALEHFRAAAAENPSLGPQLRDQKHPWDWAIKQGQAFRQRQEIGDPAAYRERVRQELMAELQGAATAEPTPTTRLPKSLAAARNVGARNSDEWSGPEPLKDILRFQG